MSDLLQKIVLVCVSIAFSLVLAEAMLRIILPPPVSWKYPQEKYTHDPEIGYILQEGQLAYTHDKPVKINSKGIRDREFQELPHPNTFRVVALGDSQTFGNGLAIENTWPKLLEAELNMITSQSASEVLNCGLPGSDTWQHEILLGRMVSKYHPDAIVLGFYVNDIVTKPNIVYMDAAHERSALKNRAIYLIKQSVLLLSLRNVYYSIQKMLAPNKWYAIQDAVLRGESSAEIDRRWRQVELSLLGMKRIADSYGIPFLVATLPRRDQVSGHFPAKEYNRHLELMFSRLNIDFINLYGPLQDAYEIHNGELFLAWDGHNTAIANKVIAKVIADRLSNFARTSE